MATLHSTITGADNHEPKGVESATSGQVYVANGSGSGAWQSVPASSTSVSDPDNVFTGSNVETVLYELYQAKNLIEGSFTDVASVETVLMPVPFGCVVESIKMILAGPITTANSVITVTRSDGAAMGSQTISYAGSTEGTSFTFIPSGNDTFVGGTHNYIKLVSDGGASGASKMYVQAVVRRT